MEPIIYIIDSVVSFCDCKYNDYYWEKQEKTQFFIVCTASGATDSALWTYCPDMLLRRP